MKSGAVLLRFPESAVSREPTCDRYGEHTLADWPDLCGAGAALAAGILALSGAAQRVGTPQSAHQGISIQRLLSTNSVPPSHSER